MFMEMVSEIFISILYMANLKRVEKRVIYRKIIFALRIVLITIFVGYGLLETYEPFTGQTD